MTNIALPVPPSTTEHSGGVSPTRAPRRRALRGDRGAGDGTGAAALVFSDMVYGAKIEGANPAKLWLTVSGRQCGKKPARDFASESFCGRALTWNAKTRKFDYAPVSTVRMVQ